MNKRMKVKIKTTCFWKEKGKGLYINSLNNNREFLSVIIIKLPEAVRDSEQAVVFGISSVFYLKKMIETNNWFFGKGKIMVQKMVPRFVTETLGQTQLVINHTYFCE